MSVYKSEIYDRLGDFFCVFYLLAWSNTAYYEYWWWQIPWYDIPKEKNNIFNRLAFLHQVCTLLSQKMNAEVKFKCCSRCMISITSQITIWEFSSNKLRSFKGHCKAKTPTSTFIEWNTSKDKIYLFRGHNKNPWRYLYHVHSNNFPDFIGRGIDICSILL